MSIFKESTQYKKWIFKKPELDLNQVSKFERGLRILAELNRDINQQLHSAPTGNLPVNQDSSLNKQQSKVVVNLKSKNIN